MRVIFLFILMLASFGAFAQSHRQDSDGDGIPNTFDKCANTPIGVNVDTHGCPKDTDGDGVPDYKDKQLITPTECQPSDRDGIGNCPCPEDCKDLSLNFISEKPLSESDRYSHHSKLPS